MKKLLTLFTLIILGIGANASHIPGGNLTYECIGTNPTVLKLKAHVYVGCASIGLPSVNFVITNDCGLSNPVVGSSLIDTTKVMWLCTSVVSQCDGGPMQEWERYNFEALVTLPDTCDSWKVSWTHCCRPGSANLASMGDVYLETTINTTQFNCENSPQVQGQEIPSYCAGQTQNYCIPAYDGNGDSLHYELTDARMAGGTPIPYIAGYSAAQPLQNVILNPTTGCFTFNQSTAGMFHVAVRIHSYKNGVQIGYVTHDFPIMIIACSNSTPSGAIANVTGNSAVQTGQNSIDVCVNDPFCFDIVFTDPNPGDVLTYDAILSNLPMAYPGATITPTGTNPLTVNICWNAPSLGYYYGTPFVNDGYCPLQGVGSFTSIIHITTCSPAGLDEISVFDNLVLYPSPKPANHNLTIAFNSTKNEQVNIRVLDVSGRIILNENKQVTLGFNQFSINDKLPKGLLFIQLETSTNMITKKLITQ